jgi:hypothetical protein
MISTFFVTVAAAASALALTGSTTAAVSGPARGSTRPASSVNTRDSRSRPLSPLAVVAAFKLQEQREARTLPHASARCGWGYELLGRYSCEIAVWRRASGHVVGFNPPPAATKIYSKRTIEIDCTPSSRCPSLPRPPWLTAPRCWYRAELRNGQWAAVDICRSGLRALFATAS